MAISSFPKRLTLLEEEDYFVEIIKFEASKHTFAQEWKVWLGKAEKLVNTDEYYSIRRFIDYHNGIHIKYITPFHQSSIPLQLDNNGDWKYGDRRGNNYFELYSLLYDKQGIYAAKEYAQLFGLDFDIIVKESGNKNPKISCSRYKEQIPESITLKNVQYKKTGIEPLYSKTSEIIGGYVTYSSDRDFFYRFARLEKSKIHQFCDLVLGRPNGSNPLLNQNQFIKTTYPVIFVMSLHKAIEIAKIVESNSESNVVITSCLDIGKTSEIDFSGLHGKKIYFIPEPTKESIRKCFEYIDMLQEDSTDTCDTEKVVVDSISICPIFMPFLGKELGIKYADSADPFERYLAKTCVEGCPHIIDPFEVSVGVNDFKKKMMELGVLEGESSSASSDLEFGGYDISDPELSKFGFYAAEDFLSPTKITGFIGESESGKTMLGYTYAVNLASGNTFMDLEVKSPHRVIYFDRETDRKTAQGMIQRIKNAYEVDEELCQQNFVYKSVMIGSSDIPDGDLLNPEVQDWITNEVQKKDSEFIFFDNIHSFGDNLTHDSNWSKVLTFFRKLSQGQRSIIFFHHLDEKGKISGSKKIRQLSQNIIKIKSNKYVREKYKELIYNFKRKDCVMELDFDKAKADLNRKELIQVWKLEYNAESPNSGDKWELLATNAEDSPALTTPNEAPSNITENMFSELATKEFEERLNRSPVLTGTKMDKGWKRDAVLVYAIQRHLNAQEASKTEEAWFTLNEVKEESNLINLPKLSEQTVRDILAELVGQKLLDKSELVVKKGQPQTWKYRKED